MSDHREAARLALLEPHIHEARQAANVIAMLTEDRDAVDPTAASVCYVARHLIRHLDDLQKVWQQQFEAAGGDRDGGARAA